MTEQTITAIYGMEPGRADEYPTAHIVGSRSIRVTGSGNSEQFTVSKIMRRDENFGDHGLLWFDVFDEAGKLVVSMQGRAVADVHYAGEVPA